MALKERMYLHDQTILKVYDDKYIKVIHMNVLRNSGVEADEKTAYIKSDTPINDEKLQESLCRTKSTVKELALCNPWDFFFTGTLDPDKYNREDIEVFRKTFTQGIRDYNKKHCTHIKYLFIPELHDDGKSWHIHGFLYGLPVSHLKRFCIGDVMGKNIAEKVQRGDVVYNWPAYADKFGFCDIEPIRDPLRSASYIAKYVTKSFDSGITELNKHKYFASKGLKKAEKVASGNCDLLFDWDYIGDYCSIKTLPYTEEVLETLKGSIY